MPRKSSNITTKNEKKMKNRRNSTKKVREKKRETLVSNIRIKRQENSQVLEPSDIKTMNSLLNNMGFDSDSIYEKGLNGNQIKNFTEIYFGDIKTCKKFSTTIMTTSADRMKIKDEYKINIATNILTLLLFERLGPQYELSSEYNIERVTTEGNYSELAKGEEDSVRTFKTLDTHLEELKKESKLKKQLGSHTAFFHKVVSGDHRSMVISKDHSFEYGIKDNTLHDNGHIWEASGKAVGRSISLNCMSIRLKLLKDKDKYITECWDKAMNMVNVLTTPETKTHNQGGHKSEFCLWSKEVEFVKMSALVSAFLFYLNKYKNKKNADINGILENMINYESSISTPNQFSHSNPLKFLANAAQIKASFPSTISSTELSSTISSREVSSTISSTEVSASALLIAPQIILAYYLMIGPILSVVGREKKQHRRTATPHSTQISADTFEHAVTKTYINHYFGQEAIFNKYSLPELYHNLGLIFEDKGYIKQLDKEKVFVKISLGPTKEIIKTKSIIDEFNYKNHTRFQMYFDKAHRIIQTFVHSESKQANEFMYEISSTDKMMCELMQSTHRMTIKDIYNDDIVKTIHMNYFPDNIPLLMSEIEKIKDAYGYYITSKFNIVHYLRMFKNDSINLETFSQIIIDLIQQESYTIQGAAHTLHNMRLAPRSSSSGSQSIRSSGPPADEKHYEKWERETV